MTADGVPRGAGLTHPWADPPAPGTATEVAPGLLWMRLPLPMALDHVNVYALADETPEGSGWTLVDTGFASERTRAAWRALLDGPLAGRPVTRVIVTHHHPDHVGLAGWFAGMGAEIVTTRTAWLMARMLTLDVQDRPAPETLAFWRSAGMDADLLSRKAEERPFNFADVVAPIPLGFTRIAEGDTLDLVERRWTVRTGGGHAPEHATLWSDDGIVLGGDQFLPGISPNLGTYATEPRADPVADWLAACARFASLASDDLLVLPGHRLPYRGLPLRLRQLSLNHEGALERLSAFLAAPATAADCFPVLYARSIGPDTYMLALAEAMSHCLHLWHQGRARRSRRGDGAWLWHVPDGP